MPAHVMRGLSLFSSLIPDIFDGYQSGHVPSNPALEHLRSQLQGSLRLSNHRTMHKVTISHFLSTSFR
jgi:hypothetical protein